MGISRRDFMRGIASITGLIALATEDRELGMTREKEKEKIRKYIKQAKLERDWAEAIKENELRKEIASTIGEHTGVCYYRKPDSDSGLEKFQLTFVRRYGKEILEENLPVKNLCQIRDYIRDGPSNKNYISISLGIVNA